MIESLLVVGQFLVWLFIAIVFHELGHALTAVQLGYKTRLRWFSTDVEGDISKKDDVKIAFFGVLTGFFPVFLYSLSSHTFLGLSMATIYIIGCRKEIMFVLKG